MKRIQTKIFSNPFLYHYLRYLFSFGLRTKDVTSFLDSQSNDNILDIGCGIGYYSQFVKNAKYIGVDFNESYIDLATNRYGTEKITFEVKDILNESFNNNFIFNKGLLIGILHHFSDSDVNILLDKIKKTSIDFLVIQDPFYSRWHLINNLLCYFDRGKYVRRIDEYNHLIANHFNILEQKIFFERNLLSHHLVSKVTPKI
jgi:SAM-dependent methyltransferase